MMALRLTRVGEQPHRLAQGGLVDRSRHCRFTFDGRVMEGHPGDTLASALLANGIRLVGRSFKYHRPRGLLTAGPEEPNALVELRTRARREPNTKATTVELFHGLEAASQNRWPSLALDLLSVNQLFSPFFVAGFYYKTFMWPAAFWEKLYEPLIRRAAGLGRAAAEPDPDHYEKAHAFCDVLVIGAGPAGLMAALAAGRAGARVILCEADFALGGRLLAERLEVGGRPGAAWAEEAEAELAALPEVRILRRTSVVGVYDGNTYAALEQVADHKVAPGPHEPRQRYWKIVAREAVLAAGATERPIVFGGNDRPGVMLASAVRSYVNRFGVAPGGRAAVFTTGDDGWRTVSDLRAAGIEVAAVIDSRPHAPARAVGGAEVHTGAVVLDAEGGARGLKGLIVRTASGRRVEVAADLLAVAGGWNPSLGLATHLGGRPRWSDAIAAFVPGESLPPGMRVAGAAAGELELGACLTGGARAGAEAAAAAGFAAVAPEIPACSEEGSAVAPLWRVEGGRRKAFVDLQNDVTDKDVTLAHREGFSSVEHLKRYTTLGMATDQGKTSNVNGLAVMAALTGRTIPETGTTRLRPPHVPVAIGAFASEHRGRHFRPTRRTPGHDWAAEQGAVFVEAGLWLRAQWFPREGEADWLQSVVREVNATRSSVGVCDVSTLGKIDVRGVDAGTFLDRVYVNTFSTLPVGKARYGLMLREDGFVMDDGTSARLAPDHYVMSTTTANAVKVMQHLEFCRQVLWPELDVQLASITDQWAQYAIAGPKSREVVRRLVDPAFDVANEAFPYLACAELTVCGGTPARLFRLSFSGELAYELAVPARFGDALIRAVMAAGAEFGITPYGTEALSVMRIEKGHVAGGELNGQTTARDLGLGRMLSTKKDFIGRTMAQRPGLTDPDRPTLVGVKPVEPARRIRAGAHFLKLGASATAENDEGYLTSVAFSPSLGHWIGLGLLRRGPERTGERIRAYDPVRDGETVVEVCPPAFVDPEGKRLHA
jgi:sarcosine oxidase subunit alpha